MGVRASCLALYGGGAPRSLAARAWDWNDPLGTRLVTQGMGRAGLWRSRACNSGQRAAHQDDKRVERREAALHCSAQQHVSHMTCCVRKERYRKGCTASHCTQVSI